MRKTRSVAHKSIPIVILNDTERDTKALLLQIID
jgi:hypothetical protein